MDDPSSSSYVSNGSSYNNVAATFSNDPSANSDHLCLNKLSASLEKLVDDSDYDYTDAVVVVEGIEVGVHRCILAARSLFFHELFKQEMDSSTKDGKPKYCMSQLIPFSKVGIEAFKVILNYLYTGKLKPLPPEVSTCVDESCAHHACGPAINFTLQLLYASATFKTKEMVLLVQRRLLSFVEKASVEDVMTILIAGYHCHLDQLLSPCIQRVGRSNLEAISIEKELPNEVASEIKSLRMKSQVETEPNIVEEVDLNRETKIRRLHKALDADDIELLKLLLNESSDITLYDAYALHYAAAYCDPRVIKEVLNLGLADLNLKNPRGQTVLHVAARRKDPKIIVALLDKGTSALERTADGQTAVTICRRLTRPKDYNEITDKGQESNKDRLCIDVLEREMCRSSVSGGMEMETQIPTADMHILDYLENRVTIARYVFPAEAKLAMDIADANLTIAYKGLVSSKGSSGNLLKLDSNETPSMRTKRLQSRMKALMKTVNTGRRFFPHCSEVLDNFLADDMPDLLFLEKGTPEEQRKKKARFMELKDEVQKALSKDLAENNRSSVSSSYSSSSSPKPSAKQKGRRK
ncbi:BTB/POZ domain and ankyrin repeat-containing protein NPR2-like [Cucurbita pepo subsp. pepo]|uniref:BTB/POZ domain and ankyrin repeat-containing protein NPR2-like n=1 Tax=Cucurbita pepo subsp. pepo TaxID=3664 RepID=UPI000C9D2EF9|nr:BTB/POZ domain and ankyrin repeat-containing protein NPR2-like [Cucurbita pepo subsp. pepo]